MSGSLRLHSLGEIRAEKLRRSTSAGVFDSIAASKERCKTLRGFIAEAWHVVEPNRAYTPGWHIDLICTHLEAITFGRFLAQGLDNRFMANVPPGTMKSLLVMVFWLAWEWGPAGMPYISALCASYKINERDHLRFRRLIESDWYQERWPLELRRRTLDIVENVRGGKRQHTAFGSLMGERADRLLIDDPHSIDDAESELDRERAIRNFRETGVLRLNDPVKSAIVIIMQRLHMLDLCGTILELGLRYVHLRLPMRFEADNPCVTPFGRDPRTRDGQLLNPERFPQAVVDRDEAAMTAYAVAGQNQQRPAPRGGGLFKRAWFGTPINPDQVPKGVKWVRGWDFAATEDKGAAFTVGLKLGYHLGTKKFYIGDVVRARVDNPEPLVVRIAKEVDGKTVEIDIPQDPGQAGKVQVRSIISALAGFMAYASPESGDKESRARPVATQAEIGNIILVAGPWNVAFLDEIETFPTGYKDQIDALSRAFARFVMLPRVPLTGGEIVTRPYQNFGDHPGV